MKLKNEYLQALLAEMEMRRTYLGSGTELGTLYFGGGTPSLLLPNEIEALIGASRQLGRLAGDAEITLEANPDDINRQRLSEWHAAGVNRLSIGIQSFRDEDLRAMNRSHTAGEARSVLRLAREAGFENFSIDLIYGIPGLSDEAWTANIEQALGAGINHLSCYALTVEPRTALEKMIRDHRYPPIQDEQQARQFDLLMERMALAGYEHYEISNFARPGHRSRHNQAYWQGVPYLGIGASAHSYNGITRQWNVANNASYIRAITENRIPAEVEELTASQQFNEFVMIALRRQEGIDLDLVERQFGAEHRLHLTRQAGKYLDRDLVQWQDGRLFLTRPGKHFADGIAADLFLGEGGEGEKLKAES